MGWYCVAVAVEYWRQVSIDLTDKMLLFCWIYDSTANDLPESAQN